MAISFNNKSNKFEAGNAVRLANAAKLRTAANSLNDAGRMLRIAYDAFAENAPYSSMANELRVIVQRVENWAKIANTDAAGR